VEYDSDLVTDDDPQRADAGAMARATSGPAAHPFEAAGQGELEADRAVDRTESDGAETDGDEIDLELLDAIEQELADVELALERLGDGTYGRCETCGQVLGEDELEQAPAGRYCRAHLPLVLP
jgi:DnaK suppressor protein